LRHPSEQYFTSSQLLAQRFRHVIVRPQAAQVLLGSDFLFPLNEPASFMGERSNK
jgi:hypothetical protein